MSEGEHTIISKIPRERLNQIAGRKLASLAIPVRLGADRETLEGELPFGRLQDPSTGRPLARARFSVVGHDRVRFVDPPLSSLEPVSFYDLEKASALEQRVIEALRERSEQVQAQAARLRALGFQVTVDAERFAARAVVKTPTHAFELLGAVDGVRVARVAPVHGQPFAVPASFPPLRLEELGSRADVEIFLAHRVPEMEGAGGPAPVAPDRIEATPPPRNALTLGQVAQAFGQTAILAPNAPVEVMQEFQHGGTRYRFVAARDVGTTFKARLIGPSGDVWSDRFDVAHFPGIEPVVAAALGIGGPPPTEGLAAPADGKAVPPHLLPSAGEVWVMNVVIEEQIGDEIRYVGTDIDGRPYGAARVLKRADFEAVFGRHGSGWRLLVIVDQVQADAILYRQLDAARQPMGAARRMATAVLVANFVPEAAAY